MEFDPIWIMAVLILGNVGATFIRVALSNSISKTLPKDSVGIGMGFFSMFNFIAGAAATGMIGAFLEKGLSFTVFQPFIYSGLSARYSSLFLVFTFISMIIIPGFAYISKSNRSR